MPPDVWVAAPSQPPFECAVCHLGGDAGPFWQGPRVHLEGRLGPGGILFANIEVCHTCMFLAVNHPDSPYRGKIPQADELASRLEHAESAWREMNATASALSLEVERLRAEGATPEGVAKAVMEMLDERGLLNPAPRTRPKAAA